MEHLAHGAVGMIDRFGYVGLFVALLLGNIGAPIGSELVLPTAGALTATGHLQALWLTAAVALAGELAGATVGYAIGRFGGIPLLERYGKYVRFHHEQLAAVHGFFERWGSFAIFICRFLPFIRGVSAIPAGIAEMNLAHFYLWTALGSAIFCTALVLLGYELGDHLSTVLPLLHRGGYALAAGAIAVVIVAAVLWRARARRAAVAE